MTKRRLMTVAILAITALLASACSGGDSSSESSAGTTSTSASGGQGPSDRTVRIAVGEAPGALRPLTHGGFIGFRMSTFAYDGLVDVNSDGEIVSNLAEKWEFDGRVAKFDIQDGVTCSDGTDFTAQTAANNFLWHQDEKNESKKIGPGLGGSTDYEVEVDDAANSLTLTLAEPNSSFLNNMRGLPMLCQAGLDDEEALIDKTIGTGPYVLESLTQDVEYTYVRREGYTWGSDGVTSADDGFPAKIVIKVVEDTDAQLNQFTAGEIDIVAVGAQEERDRVATVRGITSADSTAQMGMIRFSGKPGAPTLETKFRVALAQAVNWNDVLGIFTRGAPPELATRANGLALEGPMMCPDNPSVTESEPGYDPAAAERLLDELGYRKGGDGKRTNPDGSPLELTFLTQPGDQTIEYLIEQWAGIGVTVKAEAADYWANMERMEKEDNWTMAWDSAGFDVPSQWTEFLTDTPLNYTDLLNDEYTATAKKALAASSVEEACGIWAKAEGALWRDATVISIGKSVFQWVGRDGVTTDGILTPERIRAN